MGPAQSLRLQCFQNRFSWLHPPLFGSCSEQEKNNKRTLQAFGSPAVEYPHHFQYCRGPEGHRTQQDSSDLRGCTLYPQPAKPFSCCRGGIWGGVGPAPISPDPLQWLIPGPELPLPEAGGRRREPNSRRHILTCPRESKGPPPTLTQAGKTTCPWQL